MDSQAVPGGSPLAVHNLYQPPPNTCLARQVHRLDEAEQAADLAVWEAVQQGFSAAIEAIHRSPPTTPLEDRLSYLAEAQGKVDELAAQTAAKQRALEEAAFRLRFRKTLYQAHMRGISLIGHPYGILNAHSQAGLLLRQWESTTADEAPDPIYPQDAQLLYNYPLLVTARRLRIEASEIEELIVAAADALCEVSEEYTSGPHESELRQILSEEANKLYNWLFRDLNKRRANLMNLSDRIQAENQQLDAEIKDLNKLHKKKAKVRALTPEDKSRLLALQCIKESLSEYHNEAFDLLVKDSSFVKKSMKQITNAFDCKINDQLAEFPLQDAHSKTLIQTHRRMVRFCEEIRSLNRFQKMLSQEERTALWESNSPTHRSFTTLLADASPNLTAKHRGQLQQIDASIERLGSMRTQLYRSVSGTKQEFERLRSLLNPGIIDRTITYVSTGIAAVWSYRPVWWAGGSESANVSSSSEEDLTSE